MTATTKFDTALQDLDKALAALAGQKPGKTFRPVFNGVISMLETGEAWILSTGQVPAVTVKKYVYLANREGSARYKTQRSLDGKCVTVYRVE